MLKILLLSLTLFLSSCTDNSDKSLEKAKPKEQTSKQVVQQEAMPKEKETHAATESHEGHDHKAEVAGDKGYTVLRNPYSTNKPNKVVVYDFFGYLCGHCKNFEPIMKKWIEKQPDYVEVVTVAVNFQQGWDVLQTGYLTAQLMGIEKQNHHKLFGAIHNERKRFRNIEDLAKWYADHSDVSKEQFISTAKSFVLDSKLREASKMTKQMEVTSTPTIIINGKFKPYGKLANRTDLLQRMDMLIAKEAKAMGLISE